eukprot:TRINITY_DN4516_c0_g1_i2.p2 TRINITY_DN4516_c0_g1~~TRINITY_DN4516_c0_g1_i2.p2  ORF type:complete len:486 (-),score=198.41 TRINITY_DN4516_c0_g1_i2:339-1796(-)
MLKEEETSSLQKELQALKQAAHGSGKASALSIFGGGKSNKKVTQLTHELDALQLKEAQLEPLKKDIRRLQEENTELRSKLACQTEWSSRDEYIRGLQQEVEFLKHGVEQERAKFAGKDAEFTRLLEETMVRSHKDMEEMNRLMEQVARLSNAKQQSDEAARDLVEAQRQIRRLEDTVAFLTAASQETVRSDNGTDEKAEAVDELALSKSGTKPSSGQQEAILNKWRAELQELEAQAARKDATIAELQGEVVLLREAKAKGAARVEELEGRQRASKQEIQNFVKVIKDLQSTTAALTQSSKSLEADLGAARATSLERAALLEERAAEIRTLREDIRRDGQRWVRETVVEGALWAAVEKKLLIAERTRAEAQVKRLEHELREKTEECGDLEGRLEELQEEALNLMQQVRKDSGTPGKSPREKHNIFDDAGKGFKTLGKNISKLKPKDKGKDDIQEMKKLVAETLQRNIDLEAENKWLREHSRGRPST